VVAADFLLSRDEARWLAVTASGLARRPFRRRPTADDLLATIRSLGMVQLDTISVISRTHETVLWSRLGAYDPALIAGLYEPRLALTEYMAHAAAIIPVEDLSLFRSFMERRRAREDWAAEPENRALMNAVLERIAADGPLASRHFDRPDDGRRAEAWEWYGLKPERRALDELWMRGETVLRRREAGFSRVFDLPHRVIPGFWEADPIADEERDRIFLRKALSVLGVATSGWLADYYRTGGPGFVPIAQTRKVMPVLEEAGEAIRVVVPGIDEPMWVDPGLGGLVDELRRGRSRPSLTTLLSPFDNLTWNRDRGERLFDFHYRLECYTPAPKRKYGYYSLPILYRGKIVGRLDPSYDRKSRFLTIRSLHLEPWVRPSAAMLASIRGAIEDLLGFLGGDPGDWALLRTDPAEILPLMTPEPMSGPVDEQ
jgi:uncharacterized protein YcaQ